MKTNLYSVYDAKAVRFFPPFVAENHATAIRGFVDAGRDKSSAPALHPEDYMLMHLGGFNIETGQIEPLSNPVSLGTLLSYQAPLVEKTSLEVK